jgi:hypothetical protein
MSEYAILEEMKWRWELQHTVDAVQYQWLLDNAPKWLLTIENYKKEKWWRNLREEVNE